MEMSPRRRAADSVVARFREQRPPVVVGGSEHALLCSSNEVNQEEELQYVEEKKERGFLPRKTLLFPDPAGRLLNSVVPQTRLTATASILMITQDVELALI